MKMDTIPAASCKFTLNCFHFAQTVFHRHVGESGGTSEPPLETSELLLQ